MQQTAESKREMLKTIEASRISWWNTWISPRGKMPILVFLIGQGIILGLLNLLWSVHQYIGFLAPSWLFDAFGILFSMAICYAVFICFLKRFRYDGQNNPFNLIILSSFICLLFFLEVSEDITTAPIYVGLKLYPFLFLLYFYLFFTSFLNKEDMEKPQIIRVATQILLMIAAYLLVSYMAWIDTKAKLIIASSFIIFATRRTNKEHIALFQEGLIVLSFVWLVAFCMGPVSAGPYRVFGTDIWLRHRIENADVEDRTRIADLKRLAWLYMQGLHTKADTDAALQLLNRAYNAGSVDAGYYIAQLYDRMNNHELSEVWYQKVAEQGNDAALARLGKISINVADDWTIPADLKYCQLDSPSLDEGKCQGLLDGGKMRDWAMGGNVHAQCEYYYLADRKPGDNSNNLFWREICSKHRNSKIGETEKATSSLADLYFAGTFGPQDIKRAMDYSLLSYRQGSIFYFPRYFLLELIERIRRESNDNV